MQRNSSSRRKRQDHNEVHVAEPSHDESNWLVSYADMMTLLFGFFVLMYSFSKVDEDKFEIVRKDVVKYFGGSLKESGGGSNLKKVLDAELSKLMGEGGFQDEYAYQIRAKNNFIQMTFESQLIFAPGSAELSVQSAKVVDAIARELKKLPVEGIEVEGHTDIDAIHSAVFPSNWELSTARSSRIVRRLTENGLDEKKLTAMGFGSSRPFAPHQDETGRIIVENKAKNRRVILNIRLKPDGNLSLAQVENMGFQTIEPENIETAEEAAKVAEINNKTTDVKKKLEEAQKKYNDMTAQLKAAQELEKSLKEMEKLTKKTEEIERKVQSIKENELIKQLPAETK